MKKRLLLFIILLCFFINVSAINGDVDGNGIVEVRDYLLIRKHLLKKPELTGEELIRADVNGDGKINPADYNMIIRLILKLINPTTEPIVSINPSETATIEVTTSPLDTITKENYLEAYFLNTINNDSFDGVKYDSNDAFIFKTSDNKYILLDTGINHSKGDNTFNDQVFNIIYQKLNELQKTKNVTIDYMVLSHMHADHIGNVEKILNDSRITVKTLIYKSEKLMDSTVKKIIKVATGKVSKIIDTNSSSINEGQKYIINDNVEMYLYNVKDVYNKISKDICDKEDYYIRFHSNTAVNDYYYVKDTNGKYIYFIGKEYVDYMSGKSTSLSMHTTDKLTQDVIVDSNSDIDKRIEQRFYAYINKSNEKRSQCTSNANSLAIVFKIKTEKENKYVYLPSDLENAGYNPLGDENKIDNQIMTGYTTRYHFKYETMNGEKYPRFVLSNNKLVKSTKITSVPVAAEYKTAQKIVNDFSDFTSSLVIYQASHHGINNTWSAMKKLNVNRKGVYTIVPLASNIKKNSQWDILESGYLLQNTVIWTIGSKDRDGIKCTINNLGETKCTKYNN